MGETTEKRLGWLVLAVAAAAIVGLAVTMLALTSRPQPADPTAERITHSTPPATGVASNSPEPSLDVDPSTANSPASPSLTVPPQPPALPAVTNPPPAAVPQPLPSEQHPAPAPEPAWTHSPCPTGKVTARVDTVHRETAWDSEAHYAVTFTGTLTNNTTGSIDIDAASIPRVQGLNTDGANLLGYTSGGYDQTPAPGKPRAEKLTVPPGRSITFGTRPSVMTAEDLAAVKYWYTDTDYPSAQLAYFTDPAAFTYCHVGRDSAGDGTSIPNPYQ